MTIFGSTLILLLLFLTMVIALSLFPQDGGDSVGSGTGALTLMHFPEATARTFCLSDRSLKEVGLRRSADDFRPWAMERLGLDPEADYKTFVVFSAQPRGEVVGSISTLENLLLYGGGFLLVMLKN